MKFRKNHSDHFHQLLASKSSRLEGGLAPSRCGRAALRGQVCSHQASCERPAWATVGSSNCPAAWHGGQAVHASTRLSCVREHQDGRRVGWKASGWSSGQKVPVPAKCLVEIARTDLGPLKQTLSSRFQLDVRHPSIFSDVDAIASEDVAGPGEVAWASGGPLWSLLFYPSLGLCELCLVAWGPSQVASC